MFLTNLLLKRHHGILPYRFRGKYRIVKKPSIKDLFQMKEDFVREEQNMLILRHPYLTAEQSHGHMIGFRKTTEDMKLIWQAERNEKFNKIVTIADRLNHLNVSNSWD